MASGEIINKIFHFHKFLFTFSSSILLLREIVSTIKIMIILSAHHA
jgi:hypothetical protein